MSASRSTVRRVPELKLCIIEQDYDAVRFTASRKDKGEHSLNSQVSG